jgi:hypothetical protein
MEPDDITEESPEETDNGPRPEDGEQDLSQDPSVAYDGEASDE